MRALRESEVRSPKSQVGGKAAGLIALRDAGFNVPAFEVSPADLSATVARLGFPVAVRSSASVEDGRAASFAGQFESVLELRSLDAVEEAVERVRASVYAPSVRQYCRKNGIDADAARMDVIVQRMIEPKLAGVAFSVNPVTGAEEVVIEAVDGLADELLQGRRATLPRAHPLVELWAPEIERVVRAIHRHFGCPQDVEFAVGDGVLYVLQARPITRIAFEPSVGEWTNADFRDGGVSSDVCTPLMWSLYDFIWEGAIKGFLREIRLLEGLPSDALPANRGIHGTAKEGDFKAGRMFFGRPYWNLGAVKQCLAKLPGFVEREFDLDLSVEPTYAGDGVTTPVTLVGLVRAIPTALAVGRAWKTQDRFDRAFLAGGFDTLVAPYWPMPQDVVATFRRLITEAYRLAETQYFRTIYCASLAKLDFKDAFPDADYASLVAALPPMRHLAPIRAIREGAGVDELVERFYYHSRRELDIRTPRWDEDRAFVEQIARESGETRDPRPAYERARAEERSRVGWWKRRAFDRKLDRLRHFVWLREEMRDCSSRMYWLIRRYVLEIADRLGLGDDVFFMTVDEILRNDRTNVARARETYESYRNFKAPNEIGARYGTSTRIDRGLRGIGASRGIAHGTARVARTVEEAAGVEKGAVLVCPFTDPGWTPVLDRVAAVVTETGGLLSHAAVICREYGIPAVLGVAGATDRIPDGRPTIVDGGAGVVSFERGL